MTDACSFVSVRVIDHFIGLSAFYLLGMCAGVVWPLREHSPFSRVSHLYAVERPIIRRPLLHGTKEHSRTGAAGFPV